MVENTSTIILVGGEMGFGKTTTLEHVIEQTTSQIKSSTLGFIQPSIYDHGLALECDETRNDNQSNNQSKIVKIEKHKQAIEIHFISKINGREEEKRIFSLATLNPEFKQEDMTTVMTENMQAKKPKQPRWLFNDQVFGQIGQLMEQKLDNVNMNDSKILIVIDELGWLEMEGKGHWPLVSKLVSKYSAENNIIWMFAVRNTLLKDHKDKVLNLFKEFGISAKIHSFELLKTDSSQRKADNFEEIVSQISNIVKC